MIYDVIIVGGSAAGISAGIYLARQRINFLLICEKLGGDLPNLTVVQNYPGISDTSGIDLSENFKKHLQGYNSEIKEGISVKNIIIQDGHFLLKSLEQNQEVLYEAKSVIIATGSKPRKLNIEGEAEYLHKGLSYCAICDGPFFNNKRVAIIGGGNSANYAAMSLMNIASEIFVLTDLDDLVGEKTVIEYLKKSSKVKIIPRVKIGKIKGEKFVTGLEYIDIKYGIDQTLDVDGIFIYIGMEPNSDLTDILDKNEKKEIKTDKTGKTSVSGIFAAGDVADTPYKQIAIAVGSGAIAALSAVNYLGQNDQSH